MGEADLWDAVDEINDRPRASDGQTQRPSEYVNLIQDHLPFHYPYRAQKCHSGPGAKYQPVGRPMEKGTSTGHF